VTSQRLLAAPKTLPEISKIIDLGIGAGAVRGWRQG
jgi:hypothetical protein